MASLLELQRSFAAALRDPTAGCAALPAANLAIYRNNSAGGFLSAMQSTYPVVRRRVGDDYFRQLVTHYRARFPSTSGDLHWVGREFARFLEDHHRDSDYAWLADLARLEWSRAECAVASEFPELPAAALARYGPHQFEHLVFGLQRSLKLHSSAFPVFTVWLTNQTDNAPPVDQSLGSEQGMVRIRSDYTEIRPLDRTLFSFLSALRDGLPLGEAMGAAALEISALTHALSFVFDEGLVSSLTLSNAS